jgi:hypothetical protein
MISFHVSVYGNQLWKGTLFDCCSRMKKQKRERWRRTAKKTRKVVNSGCRKAEQSACSKIGWIGVQKTSPGHVRVTHNKLYFWRVRSVNVSKNGIGVWGIVLFRKVSENSTRVMWSLSNSELGPAEFSLVFTHYNLWVCFLSLYGNY